MTDRRTEKTLRSLHDELVRRDGQTGFERNNRKTIVIKRYKK